MDTGGPAYELELTCAGGILPKMFPNLSSLCVCLHRSLLTGLFRYMQFSQN